MLGLGSDCLRLLPITDTRGMSVTALTEAIAEDRTAGRSPLCVVGTAGTVNTGAIDPLADIRRVAQDEHLWFHIDGAYGAVASAIPELRHLYEGLSSADSIAINPHKWLFVPYEAGAVLVRDRNMLTRAFATRAAYLEVEDDEYYNGPLWYHQQGPQLSRAFRALKVWAVMRQFGVEGYRDQWRRDLASAEALRAGVRAHPKLELVGSTNLGVVCFRYLPSAGDADQFNRGLVDRIQKDGRLFVAGTSVDDVYCLRAAILNFRTTLADIAIAVEAIGELGTELEGR